MPPLHRPISRAASLVRPWPFPTQKTEQQAHHHRVLHLDRSSEAVEEQG